MSIISLHRVVILVVCSVLVFGLATTAGAQETPIETPTATPVAETPTSTPTTAPTNTPVPPTPTAEPETPTATPVSETPTSTPVPPTLTPTPTPTESAALAPSLSLTASDATVGSEVLVAIEISDAVDVDAFAFDIAQSSNLLSFVELQNAGTLTADFLSINASTVGNVVRVGGIGGPSSAEGTGTLVNLLYTADSAGTTELTITNLLDDLVNATVASISITVTETAVATPTAVPPTPTPTETDPAPTATPTPTETGVAPTATPTIPAGVTPTNTPIIINPTPVPADLVSTELGITHYSSLGFTFNGGAANLIFDIGLSDVNGTLFSTRSRDGLADPAALSPVLFLDIFDSNPFDGIGGDFVPVGRDVEFTGAASETGRYESAYFLIGGTLGIFPPVNPRLGATGNPQGGGVDFNGDGTYDRNFGFYESDIVPVIFFPESDSYSAPLVDIEPAGNDGFYVLTTEGVVLAEGDALESLETESRGISLGDATAVGLKIYRGSAVDESNSQHSADLIGTGAYVLASNGRIYTLGDAPALSAGDAPVVPQGAEPFSFQDIELIPNAAGTGFIGVGILNGDGIITFVPFASTTVTPEITAYVNGLAPFNNIPTGGFPFDIARDFEVEINDSPVFGLDANGNSTSTSERRVGIFMTDGYGGTFVGGDSTRFVAVPAEDGTRDVNGQNSVVFPANDVYLFPDDVIVDIEISGLPVSQ